MKVTTDACLFGAWVSRILKSCKVDPGQVLDIGTGTGLLPLIIAQQHSTLQFTAVEIDKDAAEQALENAEASPWKDRITVYCEDMLSFSAKHPFDLIISNPPFYQDDLRSPNEKKNKAHHDVGLLLPELIRSIQNHLAEEGHFFIMMPYRRQQELLQSLKKAQLTVEEIVRIRPSENKDFFRLFVRGRKWNSMEAPYHEQDFTITTEDGSYSGVFTELLKDYYLYL